MDNLYRKRLRWLGVLAAAVLIFSGPAKADSCGFTGLGPPTCFVTTGVVHLYYGTLTLLAPDGSLISTTDLETAETGLGNFSNAQNQTLAPPPSLIATFPSIVGQMQTDPQITLSDIPPWAISNLSNLADSNGFGLVQDPTAPLNTPPDPAVVAFDNQLADVGGAYTTLSDTGFLEPLTTAAYCTYFNAVLAPVLPGVVCVPQTVPSSTGSFYEFTYQLGPDSIGGNTYTADVNFQIYDRDVTEQLVATPEPAPLAPLPAGLVILGLVCRRKAARPS